MKFMYDKSCTHFVHQAKTGDLSKDYSEAKRDGKYLVHPRWLQACFDSGVRVSEAQYPVTYNPRMSIDIKSDSPIPRATKGSVTSVTKKVDGKVGSTKDDERRNSVIGRDAPPQTEQKPQQEGEIAQVNKNHRFVSIFLKLYIKFMCQYPHENDGRLYLVEALNRFITFPSENMLIKKLNKNFSIHTLLILLIY